MRLALLGARTSICLLVSLDGTTRRYIQSIELIYSVSPQQTHRTSSLTQTFSDIPLYFCVLSPDESRIELRTNGANAGKLD